MPSPGKRGPHRGAMTALRRDQLLGAALDLFCEHGYAGTSTRRIAEAAGVAEGLIFHYFPSKQALLLAVAAQQPSFAGHVLALLLDPGTRTARELLREMAIGLAEVSGRRLAFVNFMLAEAHVNPVLRTMVAEAHAMMLHAFAEVLNQRVQSGELRADAALQVTAHGFFGGFWLAGEWRVYRHSCVAAMPRQHCSDQASAKIRPSRRQSASFRCRC